MEKAHKKEPIQKEQKQKKLKKILGSPGRKGGILREAKHHGRITCSSRKKEPAKQARGKRGL